jgi:hypothetical protein
MGWIRSTSMDTDAHILAALLENRRVPATNLIS